jgi:hypothetical protein
MFHSTALAIGAGVVAVAAAGTSAAISMSAADRAKKAQGAAAGQFKKQQRKATKGLVQGQQQVQGMINEVQAPQYNLGSMLGDARQISDYYQQQQEEFLPGAKAQRDKQLQLTNQAMDILSQRLRSEYGEDITQGVMGDVAQFVGAGFNPAAAGRAGGFQASQGLAARQLAQNRIDVQNQALQFLPQISNMAKTWQDFAIAFRAEPLDVGRLQLGYQTAGAEVGLQKAKMTGDMFANIYNAQSGLATQIYGANKENIASSYASTMAGADTLSNVGKAASTGLGAMSNVSAMQQGLGGYGGMGGMGGIGGYASMGQAQQAAPYAESISQVYGSGFVPRATRA